MQISFQTHTGHGCLSAVRLFRQTWTHCWLYRGPNYRPPHSPPPENRASTHSHTVETDLLNVTACWAGTRQNCAPPLVPWVGHTEVGRCFGRSCWHQMTRLTKLAPLRQWWRKWRRQDGVRVRIQKWRATTNWERVRSPPKQQEGSFFCLLPLFSIIKVGYIFIFSVWDDLKWIFLWISSHSDNFFEYFWH